MVKIKSRERSLSSTLLSKGACLAAPVLLMASSYTDIYQRDLFRLQKPPPPVVEKEEVTPVIREPSLSEYLFLQGIIVAKPSLAVIEDRTLRTTSIYREGEELAAGKIIRIEHDRVVIRDRQGRENTLVLAAVQGPAPSPAPKEQPMDIHHAVLTPEISGEEGAEDQKIVSLQDIREITANHQEELRDLRITPVVSQGDIAGYQLTNIGRGKLAELAGRYGLQSGDVITSVNGIALESLAKINQIAGSIRPGSPVSVGILRQGKPVTITLQLTY